MLREFKNDRVGLRNNNGKLVTIYPEQVSGGVREVEKKVFDWYYTTGCSAENEFDNFFVDIVTEQELKL
jgi:hypothetical protein